MLRFLTALLLAVALVPMVEAGELDFLLTPDPSDDLQVLEHVLFDVLGPSPQDVAAALEALPHPELELPPALFLSGRMGIPLPRVIELRSSGLPWVDVFGRLDVSLDVLRVDLPRDPGPPYGKAWGYWKKHGTGGPGLSLTDAEVADWVNLRVTSQYFGLPPAEVVKLRAGGASFKSMVGDHYRSKHPPKGNKPDKAKDHDKGKEHDKGKGKGKHKG